MRIDATNLYFETLNHQVRCTQDTEIVIDHCCGQRFIGAGSRDKQIRINGTPGNALGAYLNGATVIVNGNAQEATGDTMNGGTIVVNGSVGDAAGYAMRGGKIFVRGNAGYRCGIHMKAYGDNKPAIVIGGRAGSFLGEYQAGGTIIVLGDYDDGKSVIGNFCGTGMHGGEMYIRCDALPGRLPAQVRAERLERIPHGEIEDLVSAWCDTFGKDREKYLASPCYRLTPNSENPYRQMYTAN